MKPTEAIHANRGCNSASRVTPRYAPWPPAWLRVVSPPADELPSASPLLESPEPGLEVTPQTGADSDAWPSLAAFLEVALSAGPAGRESLARSVRHLGFDLGDVPPILDRLGALKYRDAEGRDWLSLPEHVPPGGVALADDCPDFAGVTLDEVRAALPGYAIAPPGS